MSASKSLRRWPTVSAAIDEQIRSHPKNVAIRDGERAITYEELGSLANNVRRRLRIAEVRVGDVVMIDLPPSPEFVAAALATMQVGAAYLPVGQKCPAERLSFMISDSGSHVLIMTSRLYRTIGSRESVTVIELARDSEGKDELTAATADADPDDLAYLIYTSGSTGQPKGVEITHHSLSNLIDWHNRAFDIGQDDRGSQVADLGFDAAVWEIWPYLASGAALYISENCVRKDSVRLQKWLLAENITVAFAPTVIADQLCQLTWPRKVALKFLLAGGEALRAYPRKDLPFTLINNYGPTECTVVTTSGAVLGNVDRSSPPSIGRPVANTHVYILAEDMNRVGPGQTGEICIGGPGLARGYHNRPELTAEKFIPNPFDRTPGARLYRSGDLGKFRDDGQIEFLGRLDDQVKIRGYRVEPNEVAVAICRNPSVRQCIVQARISDGGEKQLFAYVVPNETRSISQGEMRQSLENILPEFMIPSRFVFLDQLPLTAHGKIDEAALRSAERKNTADLNAVVLPRTDTERQIAAIVRSLLKLDGIGIDENFFLLGGHSLFGAQLIGRMRERLKVDIPLRAVFECPTVASLAAYVEGVVLGQSAQTMD